MDNKTRIIGVVTLAAMAVLDSLSQQGVLAPEHAALIADVVVIALPLLGLGALVDVIHTERRRRDPSIAALPDDVTGAK